MSVKTEWCSHFDKKQKFKNIHFPDGRVELYPISEFIPYCKYYGDWINNNICTKCDKNGK